jgi:hypothetical protein
MSSSCVGVVGETVDKGVGEAAGSKGTGTGGILPSRSCWSVRMACILLGGASWMPVMASVRRRVAAMILSMDVMVGAGMVWCLKQKVSVSCSPPVPSIIVCMHQQCFREGPMYQLLEAWKLQDLRRAGLRWTRTLVPGGAMGVASKENEPSMDSKVESAGF